MMVKICCMCEKPATHRLETVNPICSRCKFIIEGMRTPMGMNMSQQRAIRFFGKQWDKKHGGKNK